MTVQLLGGSSIPGRFTLAVRLLPCQYRRRACRLKVVASQLAQPLADGLCLHSKGTQFLMCKVAANSAYRMVQLCGHTQ